MTECHGGNSRTHYAIKNDMTGSNKIPRFLLGFFPFEKLWTVKYELQLEGHGLIRG